jgi:amyloid beta precursor protein binding protein 1
MQLLQELNPDVSSDNLDESVETILENNPEFFSTFTVIIATSLKEKTLIALSELLWNHNIPLVYCHSVGFIGSARLQLREHCVVESHPDNKQFDLRIEQPFEGLQKYFEVRFGSILIHCGSLNLMNDFFL